MGLWLSVGLIMTTPHSHSFPVNSWHSGVGYEVSTTDYVYTIAVCSPLTSSVCGADTTVCQTWGSSNSKQLAKDQITYSEMTPSGTGVEMTMDGGAFSSTCQTNNKGLIQFKCDQSQTGTDYKFTFVSTVECVSTFSISHCQACSGGCTNPGPTPSPPGAPPSPPSPPGAPPPPGHSPSPTPAPGPPAKMNTLVKRSLIVGSCLAAVGILGCVLAVRLKLKMAEHVKARTVAGNYRALSSSSA